MHPAYSVIFFTTASGAGYGLLIWLCIYGMLDLIPFEFWFLFFGFGIAFGLITLGLLSSTYHLGHPERAWRAFSQWRSSWLSREGVAALATYIPSGLLAIGWIFLDTALNIWSILAIFSILLALGTVYCTGMIYASLKTIRQWNHISVPYIYIILGLTTGSVVLKLLIGVFDIQNTNITSIVITLLLLSFVTKIYYWRIIDNQDTKYTAEDATGLGHLGKVRPLDPPHSQPNFVMREMGYKIARKHADKLRRYVILCLFALPIITLSITLLDIYSLNLILSFFTLLSVSIGIILERWLFFAEAKHIVTLYYGEGTA